MPPPMPPPIFVPRPIPAAPVFHLGWVQLDAVIETHAVTIAFTGCGGPSRR